MIKNIAILKGGTSSEFEISNKSALYVKTALVSKGYNVIDVNVNKRFLSWAIKNKNKIDVFFNALHGAWGEDGKIQGVLEFLRVPYTHSGVTASSVGMHKDLSKKIFKNAGIKVPNGRVLTSKVILEKDPYQRPYIIKPVSEGSSFGVYLIEKNTSVKKVLNKMKENLFLVEKYIKGTDVTVALMNGNVLGLLEIIPQERLFNYSAKYRSKNTVYRYPNKIKPNVIKKIIKYAKIANKELLCSSITRVDFRVDHEKSDQGVYVLELNTQPGLTKNSLVPKIAEQSGVSFENLIESIVKDAKFNKI